jgi:hypothetical protein
VASQVDIAPTLLGLVGVAGYEGPGLDLSGTIRQKQRVTGREMAFTDTWFLNTNRAAVYTADRSCQRDFAHIAHIAQADRHPRFQEGCFDRIADPLHEGPFPNAEVEQHLIDWRAKRLVEYQISEATDVSPGEKVVDQLEALGYADP